MSSNVELATFGPALGPSRLFAPSSDEGKGAGFLSKHRSLIAEPSPNAEEQGDLPSLSGEINPCASSPPASEVGDGGQLPPVDGGAGAWTFVWWAWVCELTLWAPNFGNVGPFQSYYSQRFTAPEVTISSIGMSFNAASYLVGLPAYALYRAFPERSREFTMAAVTLAVASLVGASFCTSPQQLIGLNGVIAGLGHGFAFAPVMIWLPQWFDRRRGLASGIIFSGSAVGGLVYPFIYQALLDGLGYKWSLRIWALITAAGGFAGALFLRPRLPLRGSPAHIATMPKEGKRRSWLAQLHFVATPLFVVTGIANFALANGYMSLTLYLAQYIRTAGYSNMISVGGVAILNAAMFFGQPAVGYGCDRGDYAVITIIVGGISCLFTATLLGLDSHLAAIIAATIILGATAGSYSATWGISAGDIARRSSTPAGQIMLSYQAIKGLSAIAGPLVSAALLTKGEQAQNQPLYGSAKAHRTAWGSFGFVYLFSWMAVNLGLVFVSGIVLVFLRRSPSHPKGHAQTDAT